MAYVNGIPSLQDFKILIGRDYVGPMNKMLKKEERRIIDIEPIFNALKSVESHRNPGVDKRVAIKKVRQLRNACIWWQSKYNLDCSKEEDAIRNLKESCHALMEKWITEDYVRKGKVVWKYQDDLNRARSAQKDADLFLNIPGVGSIGKCVDAGYMTERSTAGHYPSVPGYSDYKNRFPAGFISEDDYMKELYLDIINNGSLQNIRMASIISSGVRYCNDQERLAYKVSLKGDGYLRWGNGELVDTSGMSTNKTGRGWGVFVVDMGQDFYINSHVTGKFHHSSFLSGGVAYSAGEICVSNGILVGLTNKTGHYKSGADELFRALILLQRYRYGPKICGGIGVGMDCVSVSDPFKADGRWRLAKDVIEARGDLTDHALIGKADATAPGPDTMDHIAKRVEHKMNEIIV